MDTKGLQNEFIAWCKKNNHSPKSEDETKKLFTTFMKEKHPKEYEAAMKKQQQSQEQVKAAAHGAKLNYFKNLKNQCAEDEEVVYYRKGGSVHCGCKKKENGGEVPTAKGGSVIEKFKNRQINPNDTIHVNGQVKSLTNEPIKDKNNTYKSLTIEEYKKLKNKDRNRVDEKDAARGRQVHKCGGKVKKHQSGDELLPIKHPKGKPSKHINRGGTKSKIPVQSCGAKVKKDCNGAVAKFKAEYGSKLKKHLQGGSLNRIPFMQKGTPKEGIKMTEDDLKDLQFYLWQRMQYPDGRRKSSIEKFLNYNLGIPERKTYPWFKESEINFLEPVKHNPYEQMQYNTKLLQKAYNKGINLFKQANNFNTTSGMGYVYQK